MGGGRCSSFAIIGVTYEIADQTFYIVPLLFLGAPLYNSYTRRGILSKEVSIKDLALMGRRERIDKSLVRLRLDWIKYALKHRLDFQPSSSFNLLLLAQVW